MEIVLILTIVIINYTTMEKLYQLRDLKVLFMKTLDGKFFEMYVVNPFLQ